MGQFEINVRKIEDYKITVRTGQLARLLDISEAEVINRLGRAGTLTSGEDVMAYLLAAPSDLLPQYDRRLDALTDRVTSVELHEPHYVKWIKTDRIVDSVVITGF